MIFDEAGTYQIEYTATDDCGNETVAERTVIVEAPPTYRTVLYTDGTFIINESSRDEEANIAAHGQPTNVYDPFDPNGATNLSKYIFASQTERPWNSIISSILRVEIGSNISPTSMRYWFRGMYQCLEFSLNKLNTASVTDMMECFYNCQVVKVLDLTSFNTSSVSNMNSMFVNCWLLETIYTTTLFDVTNVNTSSGMFNNLSSNLVGGAGTVWSSSNPLDKTYAHIDGGTADPGYFTANS